MIEFNILEASATTPTTKTASASFTKATDAQLAA